MELITLKEADAVQSLKWYTVSQNNSGGYMINNDYVTDYIAVQAKDNIEAERILNRIVEDYSEWCECCGERWWPYFSEDDGTDVPMIYDKPLSEVKRSFYRKEIILYHYDGRRQLVKFTADEKAE